MRKHPTHARPAIAAPPVPARTPISSGEGPARFVPLVRDRTALLATGSPWALVLDGAARSWWYEEQGVDDEPTTGQLRQDLHPAIDAAELDLLLLTDLAPLVEETAKGYDPTLPSGFSEEAIERWDDLGVALNDDRLLLDGSLWTDVWNWDWSRTSDALELDPWSSREEIVAALDDGVERYQRIVGIAGETPKRVVGKARFAAHVHHLCGLALAELGELAYVWLERDSAADEATPRRTMALEIHEEVEQDDNSHMDALRETVGGDAFEWILRALDEVAAIRNGRTKRKRKPKACV